MLLAATIARQISLPLFWKIGRQISFQTN